MSDKIMLSNMAGVRMKKGECVVGEVHRGHVSDLISCGRRSRLFDSATSDTRICTLVLFASALVHPGRVLSVPSVLGLLSLVVGRWGWAEHLGSGSCAPWKLSTRDNAAR